MRDLKHRLKSSALVGVLCLLLGVSGWSREGKLTDISRPYLGEYRCESLYVGGEDKLGDFDYFRLELSSKGEMKLLYKLKDKEPTEVPLEYDYNSETQEITVRGQWGIFKMQQSFPLKNGELNALLRFGNKQLLIKFKK